MPADVRRSPAPTTHPPLACGEVADRCTHARSLRLAWASLTAEPAPPESLIVLRVRFARHALVWFSFLLDFLISNSRRQVLISSVTKFVLRSMNVVICRCNRLPER